MNCSVFVLIESHPPPIAVPPALRARPLWGLWASDCSFFYWRCRSFQANALRLLRSLHPGGAVRGSGSPFPLLALSQ